MSEREAPIRVSLIGYGFAGRTFHAPLIQAVPSLSLGFVASRDADKVHADLPEVEVIGDPIRAATDPRADLVVIASPNDSHASLAHAALSAGRNVVVDKPFTLSLTEARALGALDVKDFAPRCSTHRSDGRGALSLGSGFHHSKALPSARRNGRGKRGGSADRTAGTIRCETASCSCRHPQIIKRAR